MEGFRRTARGVARAVAFLVAVAPGLVILLSGFVFVMRNVDTKTIVEAVFCLLGVEK